MNNSLPDQTSPLYNLLVAIPLILQVQFFSKLLVNKLPYLGRLLHVPSPKLGLSGCRFRLSITHSLLRRMKRQILPNALF